MTEPNPYQSPNLQPHDSAPHWVARTVGMNGDILDRKERLKPLPRLSDRRTMHHMAAAALAVHEAAAENRFLQDA